MFNLSTLKIQKRTNENAFYSFVGIKRNSDNELEFWLPHGFENFNETSEEQFFYSTKKIFFQLYKALRVFLERNRFIIENKHSTSDRDGVLSNDNGLVFTNKVDEQVVYYGKIAMFDSIIEQADNLSVAAVIERLHKVENVDWSKIHKYIHKSVFLEKDVIYIDSMELPSRRVESLATEIVQLFCYIYFELLVEMKDSDCAPQEVIFLHDDFKDKFLYNYDELFNYNYFDEIIVILKDVFAKIDTSTKYKDASYYEYYNAIDTFLYGAISEADNNGIVWGISNFWSIWEDMCTKVAYEDFASDLYFLDSNYYSNTKVGNMPVLLNGTVNDYPFFVDISQFDTKCKKRYFRPDFVRKIEAIRKGYNFIETPASRPGYVDIHFPAPNHGGSRRFRQKLLSQATGKKVKADVIQSYPKSVFNKVLREESARFAHKYYYIICDFKYMPSSAYTAVELPDKIHDDLSRIFTYKSCLCEDCQKSQHIEMQFVIPFYFSTEIDAPGKILEGIHKKLSDFSVEVFMLDFSRTIERYNRHVSLQ